MPTRPSKSLRSWKSPALDLSGASADGEHPLSARAISTRPTTSYQSARQSFETLRSSLRGEELKIAFVKNRLEVYENLVELCLKRNSGRPGRGIYLRRAGQVAQPDGPVCPAGPGHAPKPIPAKANWCARSGICARNSTGTTT